MKLILLLADLRFRSRLYYFFVFCTIVLFIAAYDLRCDIDGNSSMKPSDDLASLQEMIIQQQGKKPHPQS